MTMAALTEMRPVELRQRTSAEWRRVNRLNLARQGYTPPKLTVAAKWDPADCAAVLREANKIRAKGRPRVMGIGK